MPGEVNTALQGAKLANTAASAFDYGVPGLNGLLGLAGLFAGGAPTGDQVAQFLGQAATSPSLYTGLQSLFPSLFEGAAAGAAGAGAGAAAGAGAGASGGAAGAGAGGLAGGAAASIPGLIIAANAASQMLTRAFGPSLSARRQRTQDAGKMTAETVNAIKAGNLNAPIGENGESLGNTLSSITNFNQDGTWMTDTGHDWYIDPTQKGLQRLLHARGYPGTQVEDGAIVRREPTRRKVGGVGEMVASGTLPYQRWIGTRLPESWFSSGVARDEGGATEQPGYWAGARPEVLGSMAWEGLMRDVGGVPNSVPSTFDPSLRRGLANLAGDSLHDQYDPARRAGRRENTPEFQATQANENAMATDYMGALDSGQQDTVRNEMQRRKSEREAAANMGMP